MTIQTFPTQTNKKPTLEQQSTTTLQKGETPTTLLQRACTLVHNLFNIKHSSNTIDRNIDRKTEHLMWRSANRGLNASGAILLCSSFVLSINFCTKFGL
ncbi:MAG: hypothetical protein IPF62_09520 [Bacteroidetes bacterium]|nr:hypothetical protein [Bacteroidota bacterium]